MTTIAIIRAVWCRQMDPFHTYHHCAITAHHHCTPSLYQGMSRLRPLSTPHYTTSSLLCAMTGPMAYRLVVSPVMITKVIPSGMMKRGCFRTWSRFFLRSHAHSRSIAGLAFLLRESARAIMASSVPCSRGKVRCWGLVCQRGRSAITMKFTSQETYRWRFGCSTAWHGMTRGYV